ncbi:MAG: PD-(D/E)XK nuclease family protein [Polyangiales bacterium]|nr:PD-(D/E)XK nuclease family protein [Sandaracinaceae bacterium]
MPATPTSRAALARLLQSPDFQRFEAELARVSAFHVLGIERRELSHAALLGWLLNPRGHHGLGTVPLRSFLMLACGLGDGTASGPDAVEIDGLDLHSAQVELEVAVRVPGSERARRVDVLVTLPLGDGSRAVLVVEYKVDAAETDDQTVDYAAWASAETVAHGWPSEPLLVYLCPGQGQPASDRFVVVDYDAYLPWLDELRERRPSPTAAFLLAEFRACLGLRADVQDERQAALLTRVVESEGEAIEALRRCSAALPELHAAVARHRDALNALGLFQSRQSKGYSAYVSAFREALRQRLDPATWHVGGGEGSLVAIYRPTSAALHEATGLTLGLTSAIRVHVAMERPRRERTRAVLEVIGNHPQLDAVDSRKLREHLARDLRTRFRDRFDQDARGMIVGAFVLPAPGIASPADDTEARVAGLAGELAATAERVRDLGDALSAWTEVFRAAVGDPHAVVRDAQ